MLTFRRHAGLLSLLGLGALVLVAYSNAFKAGLLVDSAMIVGLDPRIKAVTGENLRHIFTENYWWPFAPGDLYRPVTTLTYLFNHAVLGNGERVTGYHAVNLLLHTLNAGLISALLVRLGTKRGVAWVAAAIFAVHPVHVEAVTNVVGRADLLATGATLTALWCYVRAAEMEGRVRLRWLAAAGAAAVVGVGAKETAVMVLPLALLHDFFWRWPKFRAGGGAAIREFRWNGVTVFLPAVLLLLTTRWLFAAALTSPGDSLVENAISYAGPLEGVLTAAGVLARYVCRLFLPHPLSADYSFDAIPLFGHARSGWQDGLAWLGVGLIGFFGGVILRYRTRQPVLAWGLAFFLVALLPTSNFLLPIGSIMAERFLYLPSVGLLTAAVVTLEWLTRRAGRGRVGLVAALLAALAVRTYARNFDWRSELALWESARVAAPHSYKVHVFHAAALWSAAPTEATLEAALAGTEKGLAMLEQLPANLERRVNAPWLQLGKLRRAKGELLLSRQRPDDAREQFNAAVVALRRAQEIERRNVASYQAALTRRGGVVNGRPEFFGNVEIPSELAATYSHLGDWPAVEAEAREILFLVPSAGRGYRFAGLAEFAAGRFEAAAVALLATVLLDSNDHSSRRQLAACFERLKIEPSPVTLTPDSANFDAMHPWMRPFVAAAFELLVRTHLAGHRPREAERLREIAIAEFKVPAERMPAANPQP